MLKNIFPSDILTKIYSYDSTFHEKYEDLKNEFYEKTPYWGIVNVNIDNSFKPTSKYYLTYKQAKKLEVYWNNDYHIRNIIDNPNYNFMTEDQINNTFRRRIINYSESLFDFYPHIYKILFSHLKKLIIFYKILRNIIGIYLIKQNWKLLYF